jgi:hypothetical protein
MNKLVDRDGAEGEQKGVTAMYRTVVGIGCVFGLLLAGCGDEKSQTKKAVSTSQPAEQAPAQSIWTPPAKPDPQKILMEAQADTMAGHYEGALAKHVWFYHDALKINPAMYGVRLSFALMYWKQLADVYPPAKVKLIEARNEAEKKVMGGENIVPSFHDFVSLNSVLGEHQQTVTVFKKLEEQDAKSAAQVFDLARPDLIKAAEIKLCGKYVDPQKDYPRLVTLYRENERLAGDPRFGEHHKEFAQHIFSNGVATLVALLAVSDRKSDAETIVGEAKQVWDDKGFAAELDKALAGKVPEPWPPSIN